MCDEDVGAGIPHALHDVGLDALGLHGLGLGGRADVEWLGLGLGGRADVEWLEVAGKNGWLVFSHNKKMLAVPHEKQAIIDFNVGVVFLTTGEENTVNQLRMLLNRWEVLKLLDTTVPRPFARFIRPTGRMTDSYNYRGSRLSIT